MFIQNPLCLTFLSLIISFLSPANYGKSVWCLYLDSSRDLLMCGGNDCSVRGMSYRNIFGAVTSRQEEIQIPLGRASNVCLKDTPPKRGVMVTFDDDDGGGLRHKAKQSVPKPYEYAHLICPVDETDELLVVTNRSNVHILSSGSPVSLPSPLSFQVHCCASDPCGNRFLFGGKDGSVAIVEREDDMLCLNMGTNISGQVVFVKALEDWSIAARWDGKVFIYDSDFILVQTFDLPAGSKFKHNVVHCSAYISEYVMFVFGDEFGSIHGYRLGSSEPVFSTNLHIDARVSALKAIESPETSRAMLYSVGRDGCYIRAQLYHDGSKFHCDILERKHTFYNLDYLYDVAIQQEYGEEPNATVWGIWDNKLVINSMEDPAKVLCVPCETSHSAFCVRFNLSLSNYEIYLTKNYKLLKITPTKPSNVWDEITTYVPQLHGLETNDAEEIAPRLLVTCSRDTSLRVVAFGDHFFETRKVIEGHHSSVGAVHVAESYLTKNAKILFSAGGFNEILFHVINLTVPKNPSISRLLTDSEESNFFKLFKKTAAEIPHISIQGKGQSEEGGDDKTMCRILDVVVLKIQKPIFFVVASSSDTTLKFFTLNEETHDIVILGEFKMFSSVIHMEITERDGFVQLIGCCNNGYLVAWKFPAAQAMTPELKSFITNPSFIKPHQSGVLTFSILPCSKERNECIVSSAGDDQSLRLTHVSFAGVPTLQPFASVELADTAAIVSVQSFQKDPNTITVTTLGMSQHVIQWDVAAGADGKPFIAKGQEITLPLADCHASVLLYNPDNGRRHLVCCGQGMCDVYLE